MITLNGQKIQIPDFLVEKYKKLFYLKKHKIFKKVFYNFVQVLANKKFRAGIFFMALIKNKLLIFRGHLIC